MKTEGFLQPTREPWDKFFFSIAKQISGQSTCLRKHYGCVLIRDKTVISTGFNGAPKGCLHCLDIGCAREEHKLGSHQELCRATHAEQNAVANAASMGIATLDSELYCYPDAPCSLCIKILINAGISTIHVLSVNHPSWNLVEQLCIESGMFLVVH